MTPAVPSSSAAVIDPVRSDLPLDPALEPALARAHEPTDSGAVLGFAYLGSPWGRLLAGPPADAGPESLESHLQRLGPLELQRPARILDLVAESGLQGRGGGEFPVARKLAAAVSTGLPAIVVANGSEGEPASRKDRLLLEHRPHLVLDGLAIAAAAVGATHAVAYLHGPRARTRAIVGKAIAERLEAGVGPRSLAVVDAPDRFVAGESSSVVSFLEARDPRPRRAAAPVAIRGVHGRPTIVSNVETLAHLGLLLRGGAAWFREAGSPGAPGSSLVTLAGGVANPGRVVEVLSPVPIGAVLRAVGGLPAPTAAVLLGGYGGTWVGGAAAWDAPLDRSALRRAGIGLGCGLVAPLGSGACGIALTARLLAYLASESAGQCGTCVHGLPALADALAAIAEGTGTPGDIRRLRLTGRAVRGSGGCAHPDGAISLLESALAVFADDVARHTRRRRYAADEDPVAAGWFPTSKTLSVGTE